MNTELRNRVSEVSDRVTPHHSQIVINFFQDKLDELLEKEDVTPDEVGALSGYVSNLIEVFNPAFQDDISLLREADSALSDWWNDMEFVNRSLGLDPNK